MGIATPEDCIKCTGWAITEVVERGDGEWIKVQRVLVHILTTLMLIFAGHVHRVRHRQGQRNAREHGLDCQERRVLAPGLAYGSSCEEVRWVQHLSGLWECTLLLG